MLLAVTDSDEINLVACLVANQISPLTRKLIRLRNQEFLPFHSKFKSDNPNINTIINPEIEVVNTIRKLMDVPGARDMGDFFDGKVNYVGIMLLGRLEIYTVIIFFVPEFWKNGGCSIQAKTGNTNKYGITGSI